MKKTIIYVLTLVLVSVFISGCSLLEKEKVDNNPTTEVEESKTIVIGAPYFTVSFFWVLADELGYFEAEGVDVEVIIYENNSDSIEAIRNGEADIIAITFVDLYREWTQDNPYVAIVAGDYSYGADAIIAKLGIETLDDLKGKKVAAEFGTIPEFLLDFAITNRSSITLDDIEKVNLTVDEAVDAFVNNGIDAIATFEPYASEVMSQIDANVIFDSKNERGLVVDVGMVEQSNLQENFEEFEKVVRAWFKTIEFYNSNTDEAISIMANAAGIEPEEFAWFMDGVYIMDLRDNVTAFSRASGFESLYGNGGLIGDFYEGKGILEYIPEPEELLDDSIINSLSK